MHSVTIRICLMLATTHQIYSEVKWELETIPIIVGEDAYLKCIVKGGGSFRNCTKYWMGGENFKVLDSNGNPQSPNKYRMKITKAGDVFYLIIRRVTYADTTYNYSCTCGLSIFEGKMNITSNGIVVLPSANAVEDRSLILDGNLLLNITLVNVTQEPICWSYFQSRRLELKAFTDQSIGILRSINYQSRITMIKPGHHRLRVKCSSAHHTVVVINKVLYSEEVPSHGHILIPYSIGIIVVFGIFVCIILFRKRAKNRSKDANINSAEILSDEQLVQ